MKHVEDLKHGLKAAFKGERALLTLGVGSVFYILITLSSFPQYSIQLLGNSVFYLDNAIVALTYNTIASSGILGLLLTASYALLTGVAVINVSLAVKTKGISKSKDLATVVPGIAAAGCASCGVGVLAFIGLGGSLALMPFNGNLVKAGAVLLLVGVIARNGDPELCSIDE